MLRGGGVDESPPCYKQLAEVLAADGETIRVLHTLCGNGRSKRVQSSQRLNPGRAVRFIPAALSSRDSYLIGANRTGATAL